MNSRTIFLGILCGFLLASCSQNKTSSPPEDTSTTSAIAPQKNQLVKLYLTVLDCNSDTIQDEIPFEMDSLFTTNEFQTEGHYTISYEKYYEICDHITNQDMAQIDCQVRISQLGKKAILKRDYKKTKYQSFKKNYLKKINWLKINATQISPNLLCCGICSNEAIVHCNNAIKQNYSYAEMCARSQLEFPNSISFEEYMGKAKDSVFVKGDYDSTYIFTFGDEKMRAFHFHDLGITADLNGDGIADRAATWYYNYSGGLCGITKKSPNGLIEFFEVEKD
jgi:hypothetical protein